MFQFFPHRTWLALALLPTALALPPAAASTFELPPLDRIVHYTPKLPLQVFTADGVEIAQFGAERREYVPLAQTPKLLQDAVLAVEDARFREHAGVDPKGMARALVAALTGGRRQGASTITQQLVRTMLLTREFTAERKTKEIVLALKLEQAISKDRILEIYLNEIFLGQRAYGFAAAAQTYFGKPMDQLSLAETAMLAGLPQNPYYANPVSNFERAVKRQRVVLSRMRTVGVITDEQLAAARAEKLVLRPQGLRSVHAGHVAEMARRVVVERFGTEAYSRGIRVTTSLRAADQRAAHEAVQRGVLAFDRRGAWRGPEDHETLPDDNDGPELERAAAQALKDHPDDETLRVGVVLAASPKLLKVQLASGERISLRGDGLRWAQAGLAPKAQAPLKLERGSIVRVVSTGNGKGKTEPTWAISQWPEAEAALVALDTHTGRVRALVGGFDFTRQPFNHVTQGWRQPGSAFKPLLYSAALEERVMPATLVDDTPYTAANGWSPDNSSGQHAGPITLREALTKSSNLASVRVLQHVGTQRAREWVTRFGLEAQRQPDNLTLALGTGSATPLQMARAYATLANGGWRVAPVVVEKITDAQGKVLFEAPPPKPLTDDNRAIPARNAFVMNSLLNDVARVGTGARAQATLKRADIFGKTGTTNDAVDAWFVGHQPTLATAVWMGFDNPRSLGERESGGRLALPIWVDYMAAALKDVPEAPPVEPPPGLAYAGNDWLYSEWLGGHWVSSISDTGGTQYAAPPLPPAAPEPDRPKSLFELLQGAITP
ncbi:penicillin-binding protein 1A MrcA [Hydrogenophaga taeniospiralis CCUG 15921]|uniref:Penicillin-binding protein 1A n=1 Tax=Hydrogenophaga taeniospiralis CCUG 15921 TaxID=1281780 RepID=A0A9X4NVN2_9BURK|nr:PBP1A family penicillin-binding protein [Hydrogenophaga taeniospiralis]MDG5977079.1 penicillin-binding protein 1A MrcA [Hydrogenophaga taeniospiralis CCUG 15921]